MVVFFDDKLIKSKKSVMKKRKALKICAVVVVSFGPTVCLSSIVPVTESAGQETAGKELEKDVGIPILDGDSVAKSALVSGTLGRREPALYATGQIAGNVPSLLDFNVQSIFGTTEMTEGSHPSSAPTTKESFFSKDYFYTLIDDTGQFGFPWLPFPIDFLKASHSQRDVNKPG